MLNGPVAPWPSYSEEELQAVADVLASGRVNRWTGDETKAFEREFAAWNGSSHAIALFNGTVALDLALRALGIGPGDEVIVTPRSFIASASCVVNVGAIPIFADVHRNSGTMHRASVEPLINPRTKAILPVHLGGWPCDMRALRSLADASGIAIIEDCAQSVGARIGGRQTGTFGEIGTFSFCQDKIITTGGEGGMVVTGDKELWSRMWSFKDHGKSFEAIQEPSAGQAFRWVHESFGTNFRMLELQAVLGRIQLKRMEDWTSKRTAHASAYRAALSSFERAARAPRPPPGFTHAYYRFYFYVRPEGMKPGWNRDRILAELNALGLPAFHGSCPEIYLEKAFEGTGLRPPSRLAVARELGETSIALLTHPTLTKSDIERSCEALRQVFEKAAA
ncbi:DegT/DnrJ/EryC1/StrS family aminotransferase [Sphingomonas sp. URHD0057]|uniref:DegT/DnrJ/EryC1/StrS family aminotransferase n=1 Tax=Sphingomonas sp. URHD0057 TaxID=1380389 RepID=UPI00049220EB|nr:DegT/DnrJ/EryC1/StrS aminotransferase family protein [Sphingomonas sp. URHD0057]